MVKVSIARSEYHWNTHDGLEVFGRLWTGETSKGLIVLVHGIGDHVGRYEGLAENFVDNGFALFGADFRGNGKSAGTRGFAKPFEILLDDLEQAIQQAVQRVSGPIILYGQSMGGLLTLLYTMKRRSELIDAIVVSSPALGLAIEPPGWKLFIGRTLGRWFPEMSLPAGFQMEHLTRDVLLQKSFLKDPLRHGRICASTFFGMLDAIQWCHQNAGDLKTPALIMHGQADPITDPKASERFYQQVKNCDFKSWPEMRHELHFEIGRQEVFKFVTDWLEQII